MANPPGKTAAIVSYLTIVGLLIAITMHKDNPKPFAAWHIKNMFGLTLMMIVSGIMSNQQYLFIPGAILFYGSTLSWFYSIIMASTNKEKGIPYLSEKFQTWFTFLD